jgi:cation diffusion facilitator CzcD-associated flavoprotein CzcO
VPTKTLETDYLVVGAGASGLVFTDALIADSDADVVIVDRRHAPGGHWNDADPFSRLHQPLSDYGSNRDDYERAGGPEICGYYGRVMQQLPRGPRLGAVRRASRSRPKAALGD